MAEPSDEDRSSGGSGESARSSSDDQSTAGQRGDDDVRLSTPNDDTSAPSTGASPGEGVRASGEDEDTRDPDGGQPQGDDEAEDTSASPVMDMARLGTIAATVVTVLAALGGLVLGIRAEQRAITEEKRAVEAEQRAKSEERRAIRAESRAKDEQQQASKRDKSTYVRRVDFYRGMNSLTIVNGSTRIMDMRLVLKSPDVWWDLQALPPCQQFDIPTGLLMSAMSAKEPWVRKHLTQQDLSRLRLEVLDPNGKVWRRDSGGLIKEAEDWTQKPTGVRLVSDEPWNMKPDKSPYCG